MTDAPRIPIIDGWANPAVKELFEHVPEIDRLFRQSGAAHLLATGVSTSEMIGMMDAAGIERLMMTTWSRPGIHLISNDRIHQLVSENPTRLVGVATVAVIVVAAAATWWALLGLVGIALLVPAVRRVLAGARGPALIAVLKSSGTAELAYALGLVVGLLQA